MTPGGTQPDYPKTDFTKPYEAGDGEDEGSIDNEGDEDHLEDDQKPSQA